MVGSYGVRLIARKRSQVREHLAPEPEKHVIEGMPSKHQVRAVGAEKRLHDVLHLP